MVDWIAPAKINLSLEVRPPDRSGYHPIRSLVQSIEWCDVIRIEVGDEDRLVVTGADLPDGGDNLVWKAVDRLVGKDRPPLDFLLEKRVAVGAGLGGGSSDAAAALMGVAGLLRIADDRVAAAAAEVGADVSRVMANGCRTFPGCGGLQWRWWCHRSSFPPPRCTGAGMISGTRSDAVSKIPICRLHCEAAPICATT
jgi:4-diphosphocytidyl-2-C-methyl-D-erythritol kinase